MTGPVCFAVGSITAIFAMGCFLTYMHMKSCERWLNDNHPPCKGRYARFYSRESCLKARAITEEDDLEGQAQSLIKSINEDWVK